MSGGHKENQRGNAHQTGLVFFSNPLMSDFESDWSPIHDAAFNGHVISLQNLIAQGSCVNLATLDRVTPLHGACIRGNAGCTKLLLENGANVNSPTVDGTTPLSEACTHGHVTSVSLLLQHGATPLGTSQSDSPIHRAAAKGQAECIEALVEHGADVDQHFDPSGSPLHIACSNQHLHAAKKLIQLGASVNNNEAGDSPLHIAARLSNHEMVSLLLERGADNSLRNSRHQRPVDLAPPNSLAERLLRHTGGIPSNNRLQMFQLHLN